MRVGLQEPTQGWVVNPAVHVDDISVVDVLVASKASWGDVQHVNERVCGL